MRSVRMWAVASVLAMVCGAASAQLPGACGKDSIEYKVKTDKNGAMPSSSAGMAQVVFIETLTGFSSGPVVRLAADGAWLGAVKGPSYFAVSLPAGDHVLCGSRQGSTRADKANFAVMKLHLQAGKITYLEFNVKRMEIGTAMMEGGAALPGHYGGSMTVKDKPTIDTVTMMQLSADEARARLQKLPMSTATTK